ncbi:MAG TPA: NADH-quinone oxidoreductase subunit N [Thermoplasmata archaeon]|nr:NADH-quinone oxidoreductase subunit N [Thermoplasmata archaeon]
MTFTAFAGPFLPEIVLLAGTLLIFLLDVLKVRRIELTGGIAVAATLAALGIVVADLGFAPLAFLATIPTSQIDAIPAAGAAPLYTFSSLGLVFQGIFLVAAFFVALASTSRPSDERGAPIFYGLLLLATLGMLLVAIASDLIFLLLAIEVTSIASYLLVAYTRTDVRGLEAAMKFFVIGALSTVLSFFGASLLFGAYGTTNLFLIRAAGAAVGYPVLVLLGYGFLVAGLAFKVTLVPFHAWAVDVYDGAPDDASAFLAGGTKKMGIFAFFLVFLGPVLVVQTSGQSGYGLFAGSVALGPSVQLMLGVLAVVTMTVGNVLALLQKEMKRMLAYSSISQAGYMLIGIVIGTAPALGGATLQVFAHALMKTGAFLVVGAVAALGVGPLISDWRGLGVKRPLLGGAFALMLLSLAGVPLTIGFVSKFVLFSAAVQAQGWFIWLAVAGLLNSALSVFYYARVLRVMFFDAPPTAAKAPAGAVVGGAGPPALPVDGLGYGRAAAIALIAGLIVAFGLYPQPVLGAIQSAAYHFVSLGA